MFTRLIVSKNRLGVNTKNALKNARWYSSRCVPAFRMLKSKSLGITAKAKGFAKATSMFYLYSFMWSFAIKFSQYYKSCSLVQPKLINLYLFTHPIIIPSHYNFSSAECKRNNLNIGSIYLNWSKWQTWFLDEWMNELINLFKLLNMDCQNNISWSFTWIHDNRGLEFLSFQNQTWTYHKKYHNSSPYDLCTILHVF